MRFKGHAHYIKLHFVKTKLVCTEKLIRVNLNKENTSGYQPCNRTFIEHYRASITIISNGEDAFGR